MNHLKIGVLFLLVSSLSACGGKMVDFDAGPGVARRPSPPPCR